MRTRATNSSGGHGRSLGMNDMGSVGGKGQQRLALPGVRDHREKAAGNDSGSQLRSPEEPGKRLPLVPVSKVRGRVESLSWDVLSLERGGTRNEICPCAALGGRPQTDKDSGAIRVEVRASLSAFPLFSSSLIPLSFPPFWVDFLPLLLLLSFISSLSFSIFVFIS